MRVINQEENIYTESLPEGCKQCLKGRKSVIFVTGLCPRQCFFCPVADEKMRVDNTYANERRIDSENDSDIVKEVIEEVRLSGSNGCSLTGGDPLTKLDRSVKIIESLKEEFGEEFHIHMYTSLNLLTEGRLKRLYRAGLDEVRVHPDITDKEHWRSMKLLGEFDWNYGAEIPVIPWLEEETEELIKYAEGKVQFINLNELEMADNSNWTDYLEERNIKCKDRTSYGVERSEKIAKKFLEYCKEVGIRGHYCSSSSKDRVQMKKRVKLRAENTAKPYDIVDEEGMLVRGVIFGEDLKKLRKKLIKEHDIPPELIEVEERKEIEHRKGIVREYPTYDRTVVEREWL